ncbi:YkgJ family cysteine cluster protein [Pseudorhodoferax sp.]|uniref:YkgJ family cysteine cluster protein n=1 Tax=Pseudorhodoferax sp. TaxID=1993553 RepID=UPI002DD69C70|nr:YkgJ family cysteine cluster protein [Pseudorhodoferax sp.]
MSGDAHAPPPCRPACAACCTAPSISTPIPGRDISQPARPKPAGQRCWQLDEDQRCRLFGRPERPAVCGSLQPEPAMCGSSREQAMAWLQRLEEQTRPS